MSLDNCHRRAVASHYLFRLACWRVSHLVETIQLFSTIRFSHGIAISASLSTWQILILCARVDTVDVSAAGPVRLHTISFSVGVKNWIHWRETKMRHTALALVLSHKPKAMKGDGENQSSIEQKNCINFGNVQFCTRKIDWIQRAIVERVPPISSVIGLDEWVDVSFIR